MPQYEKMFRKGEVLLIYFRDKPGLFVRVEKILPDRKKGWWQMELLTLTTPLQKITWILDDDQMRGADFTMGGNPIRIERVHAPAQETLKTDNESPEKQNKDSQARIVPMFGDDE